MGKFRKKSVEVIDAVRWDGRPETANRFLGERYGIDWEYASGTPDGKLSLALVVPTLVGPMTAQVGDWIIRGTHGEFHPCRDGLFQATYESADDPGRG